MRKKIALVFVVSFFGAIFFFRQVLTATALEFFIGEVEYDTRSWDDGKLVYKNLKIGNDLAIDLTEIEFHLDLFPFYVEPHISLLGPHLVMDHKKTSGSFLSILIPRRFFGVKLQAQDGILEIRSEENLSIFSWAFQENTLSLQDEKGEFLSCVLEQKEEGLSLECDMAKRPAAFLASLGGIPNVGNVEGAAEVHAKIEFGKDLSLSKVSTVVDLESISFTHLPSDLCLQADHLQGDFHYPCNSGAFWQKIGGQMTLEGGKLQSISKECEISDISALLVLEKEDEPRLTITGSALQGEKKMPLHLLMQGRVHEDKSFWVEGNARLTESSVDYSFCRSEEKTAVVQASFEKWNTDASLLVSSFFPLQLPPGIFSGKGTAWLEEMQLKRICWENVQARDLYFEWEEKGVQAFSAYLVCDGEWADHNDLIRLRLALQDGSIRKNDWDVSHLDVKMHFEGGLFHSCSATGLVLDRPIELHWMGGLHEGDLHGEFELFPEVAVQFQSKWKQGKEDWSLSGLAKSQNDQAEFGLAFSSDFSFQDGWIHCEDMTAGSYIPKLEGHAQFFAHFDEEKVEAQIWSKGLQYEHERATVTLPPQENEAKFYYPFAGDWDLELPLHKATLQTQLLVEEVGGTLHLTPKQGHIEELSALCGGIRFLGQLDFFPMGKDAFDIRLSADALQGKVENAAALLSLDTEMTGEMTCGKGGFHLFYHHTPQENTVDWRISSRIQAMALPKYFVRNLQFNLDFDSSADLFLLTDLQGNARDYTFISDEVRYKNSAHKECTFDFRLVQDKEEVARAENMVVHFQEGIFSLQSKGLFFGKKPISPFVCKGKRHQNEWVIEKGQIGDFHLKGSLSGAELKWKDYTLRARLSGIDNGFAAQFVSIEGLPYPGRGAATFTFFPEPKIQNVSLVFTDHGKEVFHLNTDLLAYQGQSKKWQAEEVHVFVDKGSEPFKAVASVKLAPSYINFQGVFQQGKVEKLRPRQIFGLYEAPFLNVKCLGEYSDVQMQTVVRLNTDKNFVGTVQISEPQNEEVLTLTMAPRGEIQKIEGALRGIRAHLSKDNGFYKGTLAIVDGPLASVFYEPLQKVKGVEFSGLWKKEFDGFSFDGKVCGNNCELVNKKFQELTAEVQLTPTLAFVKNLSIFDETLSVAIKQIRLDKSKEHWIFEAPLVKAQNIRLSQKKPFHIRHLVLADLKGVFGDVSTYRGYGSFNFTNAPKREESLFEIPKDILRDLGLDLNLLTPVRGEVEYQLKGGKIYLTALKNTFSEGSKSQFYLPPDTPPSCVDLDGNLRLFLRLRQDTVLKLAEPFTISVEGNVAQPKYSLR